MKRFSKVLAAGLLAALIFGVSLNEAAAAAAATVPVPAEKTSRGLEVAKCLSLITGVAISPLLGVGAVGAWEYVHTTAQNRDQLPWFSQPWFWVPALLLVLLVGIKDLFGAVLPPGWKKPFDVAEVIENKISGLVAAGAFVPIVAAIFSAPLPSSGAPGTWLGPNAGLATMATIDFSWLGNFVTIPIAMAAFLMVWLVAHAVNILILISPWGAVDAGLKAARILLMLLIAGISFINPYAGAALSIGVIVVAYFLAGWALRLLIFGSVFAWDFFTLGRTRTQPAPPGVLVFTARGIGKVPIRTPGRLVWDEKGGLILEYRSRIIFGKRRLPIPQGDYAVGRALFFPELLTLDPAQEISRSLLHFPPRYRTHEERLAQLYRIRDVRDTGLLRGVKATWSFVRGLFGLRAREPVTISST